MALGAGIGGGDSPVLVVASAVAIAIVFSILAGIIIFRARYNERRRVLAQVMMQQQLEMRLLLELKEKPTLHEIWLSHQTVLGGKRRPETRSDNWNALMPLFAADGPSLDEAKASSNTSRAYSVGVLVQLPHPRPETAVRSPNDIDPVDGADDTPKQEAAFSRSDLVLGISSLSSVEKGR